MGNLTKLREVHLPQCAYCGDPATTKDHVPPRAFRPQSILTVPACVMCNSKILGDKALMTVEVRKAYVVRFLETSKKAFAKKWRNAHV